MTLRRSHSSIWLSAARIVTWKAGGGRCGSEVVSGSGACVADVSAVHASVSPRGVDVPDIPADGVDAPDMAPPPPAQPRRLPTYRRRETVYNRETT